MSGDGNPNRTDHHLAKIKMPPLQGNVIILSSGGSNPPPYLIHKYIKSGGSKPALSGAATAGHRKRPRCSALPVAEEAEHKRVPWSADDAALRGKETAGYHKRIRAADRAARRQLSFCRF